MSLPHNHPDVDAWLNSTINLLNETFGQTNGEMHRNTHEFHRVDSGLPVWKVPYGGYPNPHEIQNRFLLRQ